MKNDGTDDRKLDSLIKGPIEGEMDSAVDGTMDGKDESEIDGADDGELGSVLEGSILVKRDSSFDLTILTP